MRILIAPDKFKGSMSAGTVAAGLARICEDAGHETRTLPIADGGEGTSEVLCEVLGGRIIETSVEDALGNTVAAKFAIAEKTAVIEMSEASGLWRVENGILDPVQASSFGTGQLIREAVENHGATKIVLGIGGSATNDGGIGMAQALGFEFFDTSNKVLRNVPADFPRATRVSGSGAIPMPEIVVACDVDNPLLGENGATRVYGPQKGVTVDQLPLFDERFEKLVEMVNRDLGKKAGLSQIPGAGAAGGLGFGLMAFCNAELRPGFDLIADLIDLPAAIAECDMVITGEGRLDQQTLNGKGPHGVAKMARSLGKQVFAVVGGADDSVEISEAFDGILKLKPAEMPVSEAMKQGKMLLSAPFFEKSFQEMILQKHA